LARWSKTIVLCLTACAQPGDLPKHVQNCPAWQDMYDYVHKNGPIALNVGNPEDVERWVKKEAAKDGCNL